MNEFDCCECGRHVFICSGLPLPEPRLCGLCLFIPSWFNDPVLVAVFDPDRVRARS
jgi:hypothetical protein